MTLSRQTGHIIGQQRTVEKDIQKDPTRIVKLLSDITIITPLNHIVLPKSKVYMC